MDRSAEQNAGGFTVPPLTDGRNAYHLAHDALADAYEQLEEAFSGETLEDRMKAATAVRRAVQRATTQLNAIVKEGNP